LGCAPNNPRISETDLQTRNPCKIKQVTNISNILPLTTQNIGWCFVATEILCWTDAVLWPELGTRAEHCLKMDAFSSIQVYTIQTLKS
jgi:hypothetical protein